MALTTMHRARPARFGDRPQGRPVAQIRSKQPSEDGASLEIVLFEDSSAMCIAPDDVVQWYPSLGVLLAAHDLEWRDVELVPGRRHVVGRS